MTYCPYDIVRDPEALGLTSRMVSTEFGAMRVVHSPVVPGADVTLMLHGLGGTWSSWTPLLQAARDDGVDLGTVVLVSLPGFGESENRLGTLDSATVSRALLTVVRGISDAPVRVVGQSMGGYLAVDMAARHGDQVTHLTALAGSFRGILFAAQHPFRFALRYPGATAANLLFYSAGKLDRSKRITGRLRRMGVDPVTDHVAAHPEQLRPSVSSALSTGFAAENMRMAARNARQDDSAVVWRRITATSSFIWGADDPLVPPGEESFVASILPGARRTVIPDAAHIAHIEQPHAVLAALAR